mmetsp:Transcript_2864/g.8442  ORF Transcript_2864/g.8442 Transcript_2864/m.8442 type:complete len:367 (-) Transcript_2864:1308-2408(-)
MRAMSLAPRPLASAELDVDDTHTAWERFGKTILAIISGASRLRSATPGAGPRQPEAPCSACVPGGGRVPKGDEGRHERGLTRVPARFSRARPRVGGAEGGRRGAYPARVHVVRGSAHRVRRGGGEPGVEARRVPGHDRARGVVLAAQGDHERGDAHVLRGEREHAVGGGADDEEARVLHDRGGEVRAIVVLDEGLDREHGPGAVLALEGLASGDGAHAALEDEVGEGTGPAAPAQQRRGGAWLDVAHLALHDEGEQRLLAQHRGRELAHVASQEGAHRRQLRRRHPRLHNPRVVTHARVRRRAGLVLEHVEEGEAPVRHLLELALHGLEGHVVLHLVVLVHDLRLQQLLEHVLEGHDPNDVSQVPA